MEDGELVLDYYDAVYAIERGTSFNNSVYRLERITAELSQYDDLIALLNSTALESLNSTSANLYQQLLVELVQEPQFGAELVNFHNLQLLLQVVCWQGDKIDELLLESFSNVVLQDYEDLSYINQSELEEVYKLILRSAVQGKLNRSLIYGLRGKYHFTDMLNHASQELVISDLADLEFLVSSFSATKELVNDSSMMSKIEIRVSESEVKKYRLGMVQQIQSMQHPSHVERANTKFLILLLCQRIANIDTEFNRYIRILFSKAVCLLGCTQVTELLLLYQTLLREKIDNRELYEIILDHYLSKNEEDIKSHIVWLEDLIERAQSCGVELEVNYEKIAETISSKFIAEHFGQLILSEKVPEEVKQWVLLFRMDVQSVSIYIEQDHILPMLRKLVLGVNEYSRVKGVALFDRAAEMAVSVGEYTGMLKNLQFIYENIHLDTPNSQFMQRFVNGLLADPFSLTKEHQLCEHVPNMLVKHQLQKSIENFSEEGLGDIVEMLEYLEVTKKYVNEIIAQLMKRYSSKTTPVLLLRYPQLMKHYEHGDIFRMDVEYKEVIEYLVNPKTDTRMGQQELSYLRLIVQQFTCRARADRCVNIKTACYVMLICFILSVKELSYDVIDVLINEFIGEVGCEEQKIMRQINTVRPVFFEQASDLNYDKAVLRRYYEEAKYICSKGDIIQFTIRLAVGTREQNLVLEALWDSIA